MAEAQNILDQIRAYQHELGMRILEEPVSQDLIPIVMATGSSSNTVRTAARDVLNTAFILQAEVDANDERVTTHNMIEEFERTFKTQEDRTIAILHLSGIEYTRGCNGGCADCYFGRKKGVTAKYTYESIKAFIIKYGPEIQRKSIAPTVISYTDNDFLDWKDIGNDGSRYTAVDIYRLYREYDITRMMHGLTTSVPKGSQHEFVELMKEAVKDTLQHKHSFESIRISVWKHNIRRIESCFEQIQVELREEGFSDSDVQQYYPVLLD